MKRRVFTVHINEDGSAEVFWKSEVSATTVNDAAILDRDAFLATMLSRMLSAIQAGARW